MIGDHFTKYSAGLWYLILITNLELQTILDEESLALLFFSFCYWCSFVSGAEYRIWYSQIPDHFDELWKRKLTPVMMKDEQEYHTLLQM